MLTHCVLSITKAKYGMSVFYVLAFQSLQDKEKQLYE